MTRVVTVAREYGSGGGSIAGMLAEKLGWKLLDRDLISRLAARVHCSPDDVTRYDEHPPSFLSRLMRAYWAGGVDSWASGPITDIVDADSLAATTASVIHEAAQLGDCVIVGRGAQCVLGDRPDAFHVFVYARKEERLRRLRHRHEVGHAAEAAMAEIDRVRASYIRRYYGEAWDKRSLYHLMMNSALGDARVVETILNAAGLPDQSS